jgi:hypothetical protein
MSEPGRFWTVWIGNGQAVGPFDDPEAAEVFGVLRGVMVVPIHEHRSKVPLGEASAAEYAASISPAESLLSPDDYDAIADVEDEQSPPTTA